MKIYYINKNSTKCLFNAQFKDYNSKLYSLTFLPYIRLFHGSTQLYFIYGSVLIMAIIAASQQVVDYKSKKEKMQEELDNFNFNERYQEMLDKKSKKNMYNADTTYLNNRRGGALWY